jgi:hypothetical protein
MFEIKQFQSVLTFGHNFSNVYRDYSTVHIRNVDVEIDNKQELEMLRIS